VVSKLRISGIFLDKGWSKSLGCGMPSRESLSPGIMNIIKEKPAGHWANPPRLGDATFGAISVIEGHKTFPP
jgi:hypothetical protein